VSSVKPGDTPAPSPEEGNGRTPHGLPPDGGAADVAYLAAQPLVSPPATPPRTRTGGRCGCGPFLPIARSPSTLSPARSPAGGGRNSLTVNDLGRIMRLLEATPRPGMSSPPKARLGAGKSAPLSYYGPTGRSLGGIGDC
jgi:hypothetical protein